MIAVRRCPPRQLHEVCATIAALPPDRLGRLLATDDVVRFTGPDLTAVVDLAAFADAHIRRPAP